MSNKLYLVKLRGMRNEFTNPTYGLAYVVAIDPNTAYKKVRTELDKAGLGFNDEREMLTIELLAEDVEYPDCKIRLYP